MTTLSRRHFLKLSSALAGSVTVSTALQGCAMFEDLKPLSQAVFDHGVASGDPGADRLIIWTRATPVTIETSLHLRWQIALDRDFQILVRSGYVDCSSAHDYTVKLDVQDLQPNQQYFYRFLAKGNASPTGKAKTLPVGSVDQLKLAVFSCSNYPAGYFNVYQHAADTSDLDYALHLGDFIYEYSSTGYATENSTRIGRTLAEDNQGELLALSDYRKRYALYRTDKGLQALSAAMPMIAVWDDHEVANGTWLHGAENHNAGEGEFERRKLAAIQAYYEWMPIRPPMGNQNERIYRSFQFGDLAKLYMLDTRVIARSKPLELTDFVDDTTGTFDQTAFRETLSDPQRVMLGSEQMDWLKSELSESRTEWQLFGQQVVMGKMWSPTVAYTYKDRSTAARIIMDMGALKQKQLDGEPLTREQQAMLAQKLPYNLDAWDAYPVEREALYDALRAKNGNVVVLAGDSHNAWHNTLTDQRGQVIGAEFATASVSSPGLEHYLSMDRNTAKQVAEALPLMVDDLQYCNLFDRGHLQLTVNREKVTADWLYVDNIASPEFQPCRQHRYTMSRC